MEKVKIVDGRGEHMRQSGEETKKRIINFFMENKGATRTDCKNKLGLSYPTIRKHLKAIKDNE